MGAATVPDVPSTAPPPTALIEGVGLVAAGLHEAVSRALGGLPVSLELSATVDLIVARIESACPALILVDGDLLGCPADLCSFARSLRRDVTILGLTYYWSEREDTFRSCVDALLHKPPRETEWRATFERLAVGSLGATPGIARSSSARAGRTCRSALPSGSDGLLAILPPTITMGVRQAGAETKAVE